MSRCGDADELDMSKRVISSGVRSEGCGAAGEATRVDLPDSAERDAWPRETLDAGSDGYMAWRAVRDGDAIVDWIVVDANALTRERWAGVVGDVIGAPASRLNAAADNSRFFVLFSKALESGEGQSSELQLTLPGANGGWRRVTATPLDRETVAVVTRDISRERYLESVLERERQRAHDHRRYSTDSAADAAAEARLASRTVASMFLGSGIVAFANGLISHLDRVDVGALRLTGLLTALVALVVLFLPWERHFRVVANSLVVGTLAFLVASDHFNHYSRAESALAVYPVFFILLIAWTGLTRPKGAATIAACVSAPALYWILANGGRASVGGQCLIVTIPVAAVLGEVLSWNSHRARTMTNLEMQRRLHDPLTGLANRTLLSIQLDNALARVRRGPGALAVLYLDLDHFKHINDTHGHNAGDDVLIEAAARLQSAARETDTVARIGGDEFVILCEDIESLAAATEIAQRFLDVIDITFSTHTNGARLTLSIGIVFSDHGTETAETLLQNADLALYRAKQAGRARFEIFGDALREQVAVRHELELALRQAISRNELRVYYQPIVGADTGTTRGFEALIRWERPGFGLVAPDQFIPIAEETGLIVDIGAWVLDHACREAATWAQRWPDRRLGISVNVSSRQLATTDIIDTVTATLARTGLDPNRLTLELTESTLIDDAAGTQAILRELRALGLNLSLDDFGTGYSSLTYLRAFPINIVKVDKSFVRTIGTEREDTAIVSAVLALAKNLDIAVVAEGVETPEQLAVLLHLQCPFLQGYLFSHPRPVDDIPELVVAEPLRLVGTNTTYP
jgi:diguanylate cyclase (GGDEF)-like protein